MLWIVAAVSNNKTNLQLVVHLYEIQVLQCSSGHYISAHIKLLGEVGEVEEVLPPGCPAVPEDLPEVVVGSIVHHLQEGGVEENHECHHASQPTN